MVVVPVQCTGPSITYGSCACTLYSVHVQVLPMVVVPVHGVHDQVLPMLVVSVLCTVYMSKLWQYIVHV